MKDQQDTLHKQQIQIIFYITKSLKSSFFADNKPQNMRLIVHKTVYLQKTILPMYIYEHKEWPHFSWNKEHVGEITI